MTDRRYKVMVAVNLDGEDVVHIMDFTTDNSVSFEQALHVISSMSNKHSSDAFPFRGKVDRISFTLCTEEFFQSTRDNNMPPGTKVN